MTKTPEQETWNFIKKHKKMLVMSLSLTIGMCTLNHLQPELFAKAEVTQAEEYDPVMVIDIETKDTSQTVEIALEEVEPEEKDGLGMRALKWGWSKL